MPKSPKDASLTSRKSKVIGTQSAKKDNRMDRSSIDDVNGGSGHRIPVDSDVQSESGSRKKSRSIGIAAAAGSKAQDSTTPESRAVAVAPELKPAGSTPAVPDDPQHAVTNPATAAANKAAAKRARADALVGRLSVKLSSTTDAKERLALQAKMLRLLPKCTPPQVESRAQESSQSLSGAATAAAGAPTSTRRVGSGATAATGAGVQAAGFHLKLQRTPKAALPLAPQPSGPEEDERRRLRQERFGAAQGGNEKPDAVLAESGGYGTSEALEKEYLRLTSLPRVSDVRPPAVLAVALRLVKEKWLHRPDYAAASEQLKAIRQDLTVQHVRDGLTVDVYETHGRLALETDDLAEFRRCHGVLRQLYGEELPGNPAEFEAYGLLYTQATAAARNTLAMELTRVPAHLLSHPFVRHALDVCAAARSGNYARFIALYDGAPRMSPYIMDRLLGQMRLCALQSTVAAYKPLLVPLAHLAAQMGLETEEEASELALRYGAVVDWPGRCLDTRASAVHPLGPLRPPTPQ